jgi:proteasome assembly chaperone (PAC2) family protein
MVYRICEMFLMQAACLLGTLTSSKSDGRAIRVLLSSMNKEIKIQCGRFIEILMILTGFCKSPQ